MEGTDAGAAKLNEVAALLAGAAKFGKLDGKLNPPPKLPAALVVLGKLLPKLNCGREVLAAPAPSVNPEAALDTGALKVLAGTLKVLGAALKLLAGTLKLLAALKVLGMLEGALKVLAGTLKVLAGAVDMLKGLFCTIEGALKGLGCGAPEKSPPVGALVVVAVGKESPGLA